MSKRNRTKNREDASNPFWVSIHEAGHAVAAVLQALPVNRVSVIPIEDADGEGIAPGRCELEAVKWKVFAGKGVDFVTPWLIQALAGLAAESIGRGNAFDLNDRGGKDLEIARRFAAISLHDRPIPDDGPFELAVSNATLSVRVQGNRREIREF